MLELRGRQGQAERRVDTLWQLQVRWRRVHALVCLCHTCAKRAAMTLSVCCACAKCSTMILELRGVLTFDASFKHTRIALP